MTIMYSMKLRKVSNALVLASLLGVGAALLAPAPAHAGSTPTNLAVTANIAANCTISTTAVAFGAYDPVVANATTALNASAARSPSAAPKARRRTSPSAWARTPAARSATCSTAATPTCWATSSTSPRTPRRVRPARSQVAPSGARPGAHIFTPTVTDEQGHAQPTTSAARLAAGQDVSVGSYSDTVVATVNF